MESKNIVIDFFSEAKDKLNLKEENRDGFLELMNDPEGRLEVFNLSKDKLGLSSFEVFEDVLGYKEKSEGGNENTLEETEAVDSNVILTNNKPEELKKEMGVQSVAATVAPKTDGALEEPSIEQPSTLQKNQEVSKGDTEKDKRKKEVSQIKLDIDSGLLKIKSLKVYTGATEERYGYVNRGDKKGNIQLTKFEYENLVEGKDPYELKLKVDKKIAPKVTVEEVDLDEEELVPVLKEKFKNTDFTVEEAMPLTDGIKIKNKITNKSEVFPIDAFTKEGDLEYANKINNWIKKEQVWGDKISERNQQEKNLYENLPEEKKKIIDEQVQKELSLIKKDREKIREEKKKKYVENLSYLDRLGIAFKTGGTMVGMSVSSIPESIYNVFAIPQNFLAYLIDEPTLEASAKRFKEKYNITNTALENYKKERDRLREISKSYDINTYENQGIMESISNEEYLDAFAQIGNGLAESAPVSISIMAGSGMTTLPQLIRGSTIALMGPEVIEQEEKNPDQNPLFATVKGMGIAAAETFFSAINAKALTFVYKDMLLKQGKDIAETTLRKGLLEMYQTALKKYGFPISALGEGFEEVLTLQTQNIINGRPLNEGVPDAFILGLSGGSMYGAPINAINFANKVPGLISGNEVSNKLKNGGFPSAYDALSNDKEVNENVVDVINIENSIPAIDNKLEEEVSNNEITEEESDAAKKKARQIQGVLNSLKSLGLNDAQTLTATNLIIEKSNLEETIKKVGDSALTTKESDRIKEINEELSNMRTKTPEELSQERLEESLEKEIVDGVESVVSEDVVTKEDVDIYTGNTPQRYGSYAVGDGSGRVEITEEEYNALPDTAPVTEEVAAQTRKTNISERSETVEETVEETTPVEEEIDMGESTKRFVPRWLNNAIEPIRIAFQDKWYSLSKLQKIAARDGYINPKDDLTNIYLEKELEAGIVKQRIQNIIETIEGSKTFQGKSTFERMYKDGVNIDQLGLYMFAKHAQERNAYLKNKIFKELESLEKKKEKAELNRNFKEAKETQSKIDAMKSDINSGKLNTEGLSGMTNEQAKAIIEEVSKDKLTDKFDEYSKELRKKLADASLQLKVDYGLVSESEAKTLTKDWEFYVPLYVDEDSFEGGNYRSSTGKKGKGLYKLKGSDFYGVDKRVNPITGMIVQATAAAKKAQANQVFNAAFNLATKLNEENVTNIFGKPRKATGDDKSIKSQGKVYVGYVNGVETAIEIKDEKIQKALEDKVYTPNMFVKGVMMANNYLRMVNTLINPEFQLTNFVRDVQTAFINISAEDASKMNTKMLKNVPNAMKGIFTNELGISNKWSDIYQDLKESGGDVSWVQLLDMEAIKNRVNKAAESYKKSKTERNLKLFLKAGGELFQATTKSTEMATRLSAYKVALDAGYTKKQASSLAKNLTVNFEKKGTAGIFINTAYLFANAGIQGSTLVIRAMTKSGAGGNRARTIAGAIIGLSIMNSYINKQMGLSDEDKEEGKTPEYAYLAPFIKNSNMVFMTPEVDKDGNYKASAVTIPLPYGYNVLWSIGQNSADVMDGTVDYGEGLINTTESFLGAFNPRGTSPALQQILPTIGQSVTQQLTNQDWMGNPLYPERENQLKSQSYYKSATEASKITANYINSLTGGSSVKAGAIDLSPGVLDNYGSFAIGGLGRFIKQTYNIANDTTGGEEINLSSTPFVRKVYKPAYENRYLSYIYKYLEDPISKNEKQKKSFEDALSAYEKKEKEKIIEKYPTKDRGGVKNRLAAEEDLEDKIIGFERKKYLAEKSLYWEKSFRANTIERKIQELVNTNITDDNGDTFNKESWNKLPTYKKDEIIRTYSQQNAKKSWENEFDAKEQKYRKYGSKDIGVK